MVWRREFLLIAAALVAGIVRFPRRFLAGRPFVFGLILAMALFGIGGLAYARWNRASVLGAYGFTGRVVAWSIVTAFVVPPASPAFSPRRRHAAQRIASARDAR